MPDHVIINPSAEWHICVLRIYVLGNGRLLHKLDFLPLGHQGTQQIVSSLKVTYIPSFWWTSCLVTLPKATVFIKPVLTAVEIIFLWVVFCSITNNIYYG